jgi:hypothetical protein
MLLQCLMFLGRRHFIGGVCFDRVYVLLKLSPAAHRDRGAGHAHEPKYPYHPKDDTVKYEASDGKNPLHRPLLFQWDNKYT